MSKTADDQTHFLFNKCFFDIQAVDGIDTYLYFEAEDGQCVRIPIKGIRYMTYTRRRGAPHVTAAGTQYDWSFLVTFYNKNEAVLAEANVRTEDKEGLDKLEARIVEAQKAITTIG